MRIRIRRELTRLSLKPCLATRCLHSTHIRSASEVPRNPLEDPMITNLFEKLRNHQGAIDAMLNLRNLMDQKGKLCPNIFRKYAVDYVGLNTTTPPTTLQIMKMAADSELRNRVVKVRPSSPISRSEPHAVQLVEEMKAAGVDMDPSVSLSSARCPYLRCRVCNLYSPR